MALILFDPNSHFKPIIDYNPGSLLIVGRCTILPNRDGYYFLINYFLLKKGTKKEYLTKLIDNPKYDKYHVYPKYFDSNEINEVVYQISKLERENESNDFILKA